MELDQNQMDVDPRKSPTILYEDEFCKVTKKSLIVMNYKFWATEKVIPLTEIRSICYIRQNLSENLLFRYPPIHF